MKRERGVGRRGCGGRGEGYPLPLRFPVSLSLPGRYGSGRGEDLDASGSMASALRTVGGDNPFEEGQDSDSEEEDSDSSDR